MKDKHIIDLEKYRSIQGQRKSRVFTGRDRGKYVRTKSDFDKIFQNSKKVLLRIPEDIFSITPSFLEELFLNMAKKYSKEEILEKIDLSGNKYDLFEALSEAIDRIKQDVNGLE